MRRSRGLLCPDELGGGRYGGRPGLADGETYRRLAEGIARRKNSARPRRISWPLPPGRGGLKLGHGERR